VAGEYLGPEDRVLLIDDFLARGGALFALSEICRQAGASVAGAGVVIEKSYQDGGRKLRESGMKVVSLARIAAMDENGVTFEEEESGS
jgi:xanthine phosphoribosyltransferase